MTHPEYTVLEVVPAKMKTVAERVLVKEASKRMVHVPAVYETVEERVLAKEASKRMVYVPAVYETVEERVLAKEASKRMVYVPAVYETVEERVVVKEASKRMVYVPAVYETVEERVVVKEAAKRLNYVPAAYESTDVSYVSREAASALSVVPASFTDATEERIIYPASTGWEYSTIANCTSTNPGDCQVLCFVEKPAQTRTIAVRKLAANAASKTTNCADGGTGPGCQLAATYKRQVVKMPARVEEIEIPAEYTTRKRLVVKTPARVEEAEIPAEYATFKREVVKTPARVEEIEIPAEYTTRKRQVVKTPARAEEIEIPGEYTTVKRQVVKTPATSTEVEIPAEYATITREVVDVPATSRSKTVPAEYVTISRTELVKAGGITAYEEIDCKLISYSALPIYYSLGSAALTAEARKVIDENLLALLVGKPNVSVEIASHTDSRGNDAFNMALSQRRAESVVNYLVGKGINRSRLVAKGFGETKLVNRCANDVDCTDEEHGQNRRTEFRVIGQ